MNRDSTQHVDRVEKVATGSYAVHTEIAINAPAEVVWSTLLDVANMEWSSSFKGLDGNVAEGATVMASFKVMGRRREFEHTLIEVEPGVQWAWSDPFLLGMSDHHVYRVESLDQQRSRFAQLDQLTGGAAAVLGRPAAEAFKRTYAQFNTDLKTEAERRHRTGLSS